MTDVVVLDMGSGNVLSVVRAVERAGANVQLTADPARALEADGLVVPGVGAFGAVMKKLRSVHGDVVIERRLAGGRPVLGICVGLQIMFERSLERGECDGLGQWPGIVKRLNAPIVPHMGWSCVEVPEGSVLFSGVEHERFYFVHSYAVHTDPREQMISERFDKPLVTWAEHGSPFVAAVENGPLVATQFHPEKSGQAGAILLSNWVNSLV